MKSSQERKNYDSYETPIINLSNTELTLEESKELNLGLECSFVDKNRNTKNCQFQINSG